jgi:hypothetical protein
MRNKKIWKLRFKKRKKTSIRKVISFDGTFIRIFLETFIWYI